MKLFCWSIMFILVFPFLPSTVHGEKFDLNWGSTSQYSGLYANTVAIVNIINQAYPNKIIANVVKTEGFADNLIKLKNKSIHIGPASIIKAHAAFRGFGEYKGNAIPGLRSLWGGYITPIHIIASDASGVKSIDQIDGLTFAMNPGTTSGKFVKMFFDSLGIKPNYKSYSIALSNEAMKSGAVECWYKAGYKDDLIIELENLMAIKILPINKEMIAKMNAKYPGYGLTVSIPAGLYNAVTQDQLSLAYVVSDFANEDVPEEIIYNIVKSVWERRRQLTRSLPTLKKGRFEDMYDMAIDYGLSVPFHPGAAKFYRERLTNDIPENLLPLEMKSNQPAN